MIEKMEDMFEKQVSQLTEKEQNVVRWIKDKIFIGYDFIKPFLIAVAMFWIFDRIKKAVGFQDALYVCVVIIIIFLRLIYSKIGKVKS